MAKTKNSGSITIQQRLTDDDRDNYKKLSISNINDAPKVSYMTVKQIKDLGLNDVQRGLDSANFVKMCNKNGGFDMSLINPIKIHIDSETGEKTCPDGAHTASSCVGLAELGLLSWTHELPVIIYTGTKEQACKVFALHNRTGIKPVSAESVTIAEVGYSDPDAIAICNMMKKYGRTFRPMKNYLGNDPLLKDLMSGREVKRSRLEYLMANYSAKSIDYTFNLLEDAFPNARSDSMMLLVSMAQLFDWFPIMTNQPEPWDSFQWWFKFTSNTEEYAAKQESWIKTRSGDSGSERFIAMNIVSKFIETQFAMQSKPLDDQDIKSIATALDPVYINIITGRYNELMLDNNTAFKGKELLKSTLSAK